MVYEYLREAQEGLRKRAEEEKERGDVVGK